MPVRRYKPTSPGRRFMSVSSFEEITKSEPEKSLTEPLKKSGDPNRSARIALLHYADGAKAYILAPARLQVGATVESGPGADIKPGNALPLQNIPTGTLVHNVELKPGKGRHLARSRGSVIQHVAKDDGPGVLRLPSGDLRSAPLTSLATIAQVGNV